jgi:transcriptional regulator with XRE-family HTH domain
VRRIRARLRALREERGLSLDGVADAAGMAPSTLSRLETGKRRLAVEGTTARVRTCA